MFKHGTDEFISATEVARMFDLILHKLDRLQHTEDTMNQSFDDVIAVVTAAKTADESLIALVNGLEAKVADALSTTHLTDADQAKLDAVFTTATDSVTEVNAALAANVPVVVAPPAA